MIAYRPILLAAPGGPREIAKPTICERCIAAEDAAARELEEAAQQIEREQIRATREAKRVELLQSITGNAAEHRDMTFDSFDSSECGPEPLKHGREFFSEVTAAGPYDPVRGVLYCGDTGNGKTHLVIAAGVNALLMDPSFNPNDIVFDRADELIMRIQDCYGSGRSTFDTILDRRFNARLWILDDFGTEKATEDAARLLTLIFSRRALRPTAVTMNGSLEEIQANRPELGRVLSRFGPQYFRVVPVHGHDRRFG